MSDVFKTILSLDDDLLGDGAFLARGHEMVDAVGTVAHVVGHGT